jgi:hypothetical protein
MTTKQRIIKAAQANGWGVEEGSLMGAFDAIKVWNDDTFVTIAFDANDTTVIDAQFCRLGMDYAMPLGLKSDIIIRWLQQNGNNA